MASWDPERYLGFADHRTRPARDLLAAIHCRPPRRVVDLGCGAGNVSLLLAERWPEAAMVGIDNSEPMLETARKTAPGIRFDYGDIASWTPSEPPDVIYSNAALQWVPDHEALFPRLLDALAPGGVLAVQMPLNFRAPSHRIARELAAAPEWRTKLGDRLADSPVASAADYHRLLAPLAAVTDIWETEYLQVLEGDSPIVKWMCGTTLRPILDVMDEGEARRFLTAYSERIDAVYSREADGTTLFPFRRLFIVAVARDQ
ncbi:MAG: trans-aconitate 2-methyltransferase [Rhodospirillaceae bacterium]|nr:trans-aconitate 2-methyltransferase [Rhodospirillaceae bacterium]